MIPASRVRLGLLAALMLAVPRLAAQSVPAHLAHVRWPLIDLVVLPDSCIGVWLLVSPNPGTTAWADGTPLVTFELDPVEALQWATVARTLSRVEQDTASAPGVLQTPPLRTARGARLMILARNAKARKAGERFVLAVSDSTSDTHWRALASARDVERLVEAIERTGEQARTIRTAPDSTHAPTENDPSLDSPVELESVPAPEYPHELVRGRLDGQVWLEYVVGPDGRVEEEASDRC